MEQKQKKRGKIGGKIIEPKPRVPQAYAIDLLFGKHSDAEARAQRQAIEVQSFVKVLRTLQQYCQP